jgi:hypothetical protein
LAKACAQADEPHDSGLVIALLLTLPAPSHHRNSSRRWSSEFQQKNDENSRYSFFRKKSEAGKMLAFRYEKSIT